MDRICGALARFLRGGGTFSDVGIRYAVFCAEASVRQGHGGTPVMIYVIGTGIERIGTESDEAILTRMLGRGFAVVVLDYAGAADAVPPNPEWSVQALRRRIMNGEPFAEIDGFGGGSYPETLVIPAGYDVSYGNVYWQFDRHGADGSLEKIVEIWNNDFRGTNAEKLVRWVDADGRRKAVQCGHDGSEPVWLDKDGNADENGAYVRIRHTLARQITDCVRADGSPIDLKLYMHLIYPTNPAERVPVMCLASSSESLCAGSATADRPHLLGALFRGYAGVLFDYGYTPMARNDHYGYFDGYPRKGHVTGDNCTYSLKHYNDFSDTAAMRYIRYLALSDERFRFDTDAIGVYGNSKGGWMTFLGEENPDAMPPRRMFAGHHGETRYENGDTEDRGIIGGGEVQPWLSYNGEAVFGGANFIYSSCGACHFAVSRGHSPMFVSCNRMDESCFGTSNAMVNLGRVYDIPTMWLEIPLGHTLAHDADLLYGADSYDAFFRFAGTVLRGDAVCAIGARVNRWAFPASVTVLFSGSVSAAEAAKITLRDADGSAVSGAWSGACGGLEWTFTPDAPRYGAGYALSVPADLHGENGKKIQSALTCAIEFGAGETAPVGDSLTVEAKADRRYIAFRVENDGVNTVGAYLADGTRLGGVNASGRGLYRIDITAAGALRGESLTLRAERAAQNRTESPALRLGGNAVGGEATAPDGTKAIAVTGFSTCTRYPTEEFYNYPAGALAAAPIVRGEPLDESDIGRRFRIRFRLYDTDSRYIQFGLNHLSQRTAGVADYRRVLACEQTRRGEWTEYSLDYTVYEPLHGDHGRQKKQFFLNAFGRGNADSPLYAADLTCEEIVTDPVLGEPCIVYEYGEQPTQPGESDIECPKSAWTR